MVTAAAVLLSLGMVAANPAPASAAPLGSPENVTATAGRRLIAVNWAVPSTPGGTINRYRATATSSLGSGFCDAAAGVYTCTISSLEANIPYTVSVVACPNANDDTDCSAPAQAANPVKAGPPATPKAPTVEFVDSPTKVRLTWTDNDIGAGIATYKVTPSSATNLTGTCTALVQSPTRTCDYENLTPDASYTFRLTAIGVTNGTLITGTSPLGPASEPKVAGLPQKMAKPTVTRVGDTAVTVSFAKPAGSQAIAGYTVSGTSTDGGSPVTCEAAATATECAVTGLTAAKTYTFTVVAKGENTAAGVSPASDASDAITPGVPAMPATPIVELGAVAGQVIVRWEGPDLEAGGVPTSYSVTSAPTDNGTALNDASCTNLSANARSCNYGSLQDGKGYKFKVTATNAAGSSTSAWSDAVVSQLPAVPTTPTASLGNAPGKVLLTWPVPTSGGPVVFYTVTAIPASGSVLGVQSPGCGFNLTNPSCEITGLDTTKEYTFKVTAVGDLGTAESLASTAIVPNKPGAPTTVAVEYVSPTAGTVTWGHPGAGTGGVVASYTVTATPAGGSAVTGCNAVAASTTSCAFTGLDQTKSYTFRVSATNPSGSTEVIATATTPNIPSAPQNVEVALVAATPGSVDVSWIAPATGTAHRYVVKTTSPDQGTLPSDCVVTHPTVNCVIAGLDVAKSYRFTVRAENILGGTDAGATTALVPNKPGAATNVLVAVPVANQATVTWSPPATGGAVDSYTVTAASADNGAAVPSESPCAIDLVNNPSSQLTCSFTGLTPGASYSFTIRATNLAGNTDFGPTTPVMASAPGAPGNVTAILGNAPGKATVTWTQPTGGAVSRYTVTANSATNGATTPVVCEVLPPAANTCSFTTLTPAASYTFTARAENAIGGADASPTSALVPNVPGLPTTVNLTLAAGTPGSVEVRWDVPADGGVPTGYTVTPVSATNGAYLPSACVRTSEQEKVCIFTGLTMSATYTFEVRATNAAGPSSPATSSSVVPNKPGAVTNLVVTLGSTPGDATVTWDPPLTGAGAVVNYTVSASSDASGSPVVPTGCTVAAGATRTCALSGMTTSAPYTFTVNANNASGSTPLTSPVIVPNAAGAPTSVNVSLGNVPGTAIVTWAAPNTLGPAVTYTVTPASSDNTATIPSVCTKNATDTLSCEFTTLTQTAPYTFTVRAQNPSGGTNASATAPVKPNKPGAPTNVSAVQGDLAGKATVSWTAPSDLGAPANYLVTATPSGGGTATTCAKLATDPTNCTLTGLDVSKTYSFAVKAINLAGESETAAGETFIPNTPAKPTGVTVTPDPATPGKITVGWTQPAGAAVTGWTVTATSADGGAPVAPCTRTSSQSTECVFTGLTTIASYSFLVRATNLSGGTDSDPTIPVTANRPNPTGPPMVEPLAADRARVSWTAPMGGGQVTKYTVTAYPVSAPTAGVTSTPCTDVVGLSCEFDTLNEAEFYTFKVTAIGSGGSAVSEPSVAITTAGPGMPGTPSVALAGPGAVRVTWTAPDTGGPVTGYTVVSNPELSAPARCTNVKVLTCVFDRLASGTPYSFAVVASGTSGRETPSAVSETIVPGPPGVPERVMAAPTEDGTKVQVHWGQPFGGGTIVGYVVKSTEGDEGCSTESATVTFCEVTGLDPAVSYTFQVKAIGPEGAGDSPFSPPTWEVIPGAPYTPGDVEAAAGDGQVAVSWAAPMALAERVDHYRAVARPGMDDHGSVPGPDGPGILLDSDEFFCETASSSDTECIITGLKNLTTYAVMVIAVGPTGLESQPSWPGVRVRPTAGAPGSPTDVLAESREASALVTWKAPAETGDGIARYQVTAVHESERHICLTTGPALSCTVKGLANGVPYKVTVVSIGKAASGFSAPSAPTTVTPRIPPGVPADVTVTSPTARSLMVQWTPNGGGDGLAGFTASTGGTSPLTCTAPGETATTCTITNVPPGDYSVSVVANGTQPGVFSAPSEPVPAKAVLGVAPTLPSTTPTTSNLVTLSTSTVKQGGVVVVTGSGFAPHTGISLGVYSSLVRTGSTTTDGSGAFTAEVTIPNTVTTGAKTVVAGGLPPTGSIVRYAKAALTVTVP